MKLFECNYLPLSDRSEGDMLRRIWFFVDTAFDESKIQCRGGEKSSKSSCASRNQDRTLAALEKMERKQVGRKVDMFYLRYCLEYGCCECGRYDDQTKELHDGGFKMTKVLKGMLHRLYKSAPAAVRDLTLVGFLLFETKFTLMLADAPVGYVCRINHMNSIDLPEEADDINNQLLTILEVVYKANTLVRKSPVSVALVGLNNDEVVSPCFHSEGYKQKRKRSNEEEEP